MAKKITTDNVSNDVDTLLDETSTNGTSEETRGELPTNESQDKITYNGKEYTKAELDAEIKRLDDEKKALKAAAKGEKPKTAAKEPKGIMVAFKNKAGETIYGPGVKYFVARHGGKLHYKEASQVSFLPKDWKDGDPIPAPGSEESIANLTAAEAPKA